MAQKTPFHLSMFLAFEKILLPFELCPESMASLALILSARIFGGGEASPDRFHCLGRFNHKSRSQWTPNIPNL